MSWNASVVATDAANVLVKEVSSINARGRSMILSLESDKWETRANTLDNMLPKDVEANAMLRRTIMEAVTAQITEDS